MTKGKSENIRLTMPVSETRDHIQGAATAQNEKSHIFRSAKIALFLWSLLNNVPYSVQSKAMYQSILL
jgi:hypothetical protein